jgi:D-alanine-D-alanine ligase
VSAQTAVGVFFGGRSVEHEVSVITAQQAMAALPPDKFRAVPIYVAKSGAWYTGDSLRTLDRFRDVDRLLNDATRVTMRAEPQSSGALIAASGKRGIIGGGDRIVDRVDVALPLIHGSHGEDGTLQGFLEFADLAYAGCGVSASAISMDKHLAKRVLRDAGLAVLDDVAVGRAQWQADKNGVCVLVERQVGYPMYVKPRSLGSSIGVARADNVDQLEAAFETAFTYDSRCIVEAAQDSIVEINCSVLGRGDEIRVSVCEQPVSGGLLSYADKYLSKRGGDKPGGDAPLQGGMKGAKRLIPAPLPDALTERIQSVAVAAFKAIDAEGVVRVDFLVDVEREHVVVNEVNTVPGSLSFYLWEPAGLTFPDLLSMLFDFARRRHEEKARTSFSIDSWLLSGRPSS